MKLRCIIDTSSCICLSNAEFSQKTLLAHFKNFADIGYCKEVSIELRDHKDKNLPSFLFDRRSKIKTTKFSMDQYEIRMLSKVLPSRKAKGNKGEIDNFLLSVDQSYHIKLGPIIFLTDDNSAVKGVLADWLKSFPAITKWTSYDVILFLYSMNIIPSIDIALDMIQSIISFTAPKPEDRSPKTAQKLIALKRDYSNRIKKISSLLK